MTDDIATGLLTINQVRCGIRFMFAKILVKFTPEIFGDDKTVSVDGDDVCFQVISTSCWASSQITTIMLPWILYVGGPNLWVFGCSLMPQSHWFPPIVGRLLKRNKYVCILSIAVMTLLYITISMITIFSMYIMHVCLGSGCNSYQGHVNDSGEFWRVLGCTRIRCHWKCDIVDTFTHHFCANGHGWIIGTSFPYIRKSERRHSSPVQYTCISSCLSWLYFALQALLPLKPFTRWETSLLCCALCCATQTSLVFLEPRPKLHSRQRSTCWLVSRRFLDSWHSSSWSVPQRRSGNSVIVVYSQYANRPQIAQPCRCYSSLGCHSSCCGMAPCSCLLIICWQTFMSFRTSKWSLSVTTSLSWLWMI